MERTFRVRIISPDSHPVFMFVNESQLCDFTTCMADKGNYTMMILESENGSVMLGREMLEKSIIQIDQVNDKEAIQQKRE